MKKSKMSLAVLLALALSLGLAASSWAQPWGGPGMMGPRFMNLSPEQAGKLFDLKQKFLNDTAKLRKQLCINRVELMGLWRTEKPDEKAIQAKQKALNDLRGQLQEKATTFRFEARKIAPQMGWCFGSGMGWGRGFMGHGGMMGPIGGPGLMMGPGPHGGYACPYYGGGPGGPAGPAGPIGPPPAAPAKAK
jgi:Spy/CpxP family protein refolding chaperone